MHIWYHFWKDHFCPGLDIARWVTMVTMHLLLPQGDQKIFCLRLFVCLAWLFFQLMVTKNFICKTRFFGFWMIFYQAAFYCMLQAELTPEEVNLSPFWWSYTYMCTLTTRQRSNPLSGGRPEGLDGNCAYVEAADRWYYCCFPFIGWIVVLTKGKSLPMEKYACRKAERWHNQGGR